MTIGESQANNGGLAFDNIHIQKNFVDSQKLEHSQEDDYNEQQVQSQPDEQLLEELATSRFQAIG